MAISTIESHLFSSSLVDLYPPVTLLKKLIIPTMFQFHGVEIFSISRYADYVAKKTYTFG